MASVPELDLDQQSVEWTTLDDGHEALLVNGGGIDGGDGAYFANYGEDVHARSAIRSRSARRSASRSFIAVIVITILAVTSAAIFEATITPSPSSADVTRGR